MPERGSKTSTVPVVWATFGSFSARSIWFPVGRDRWSWTKPGYIIMTRRQSNNQWSGGIAAHSAPKNSECKNPLEKFSPRFFGIKTESSSLIIFKRAKLSTWSITYLCLCNWRTFRRKNAAGRSPRGSCSCTTMSRLTGHLQPRRNWPTWASSVLITHPTLRIWPRRTTTCSLDWKNNWKVAIFRPTRRSLLPRRPGWTDNFLIFFFSGLQQLEQRAKKCIELRGEYAKQISSLVAVACFFPGRAKDLSAPLLVDALPHGCGTRWRIWLRHCATSRKYVDSIPDVFIGFTTDLILPAVMWPGDRLSI